MKHFILTAKLPLKRAVFCWCETFDPEGFCGVYWICSGRKWIKVGISGSNSG